jgi:hypothetical protein
MASNKISKDGAESKDTIKDLSPQDAQAEDIKGGVTSPAKPGVAGGPLDTITPPVAGSPSVPPPRP